MSAEFYADARMYDRLFPGGEAAVDFYRAAAGRQGGRVLELGSGTGRKLIPIAADGHPCTGVELSPDMLAEAQRQASDRGVSVEWVPGDMRDFCQPPWVLTRWWRTGRHRPASSVARPVYVDPGSRRHRPVSARPGSTVVPNMTRPNQEPPTKPCCLFTTNLGAARDPRGQAAKTACWSSKDVRICRVDAPSDTVGVKTRRTQREAHDRGTNCVATSRRQSPIGAHARVLTFGVWSPSARRMRSTR